MTVPVSPRRPAAAHSSEVMSARALGVGLDVLDAGLDLRAAWSRGRTGPGRCTRGPGTRSISSIGLLLGRVEVDAHLLHGGQDDQHVGAELGGHEGAGAVLVDDRGGARRSRPRSRRPAPRRRRWTRPRSRPPPGRARRRTPRCAWGSGRRPPGASRGRRPP